MLHDEVALEWARVLCDVCWKNKLVPDSWRDARVVSMSRKGDEALPSNYKQISLLSVECKIFAAMLLGRLKRAGAEQRVRATQFGFKSGCGTVDALFIARRATDAAWEAADGSLLIVLLDWGKAFDRIDPSALMNALTRFGVPADFTNG